MAGLDSRTGRDPLPPDAFQDGWPLPGVLALRELLVAAARSMARENRFSRDPEASERRHPATP